MGFLNVSRVRVLMQTIQLMVSRLAWPLRRLCIFSFTPIPAPSQLVGGFTWLWRMPQSRLCVFLLTKGNQRQASAFSLKIPRAFSTMADRKFFHLSLSNPSVTLALLRDVHPHPPQLTPPTGPIQPLCL